MIEQFYFPDPSREQSISIEKTDEDYYPKYVSHSPFLDEIEKGFNDAKYSSALIYKPENQTDTPIKCEIDVRINTYASVLSKKSEEFVVLLKEQTPKKVAKKRVKKDK